MNSYLRKLRRAHLKTVNIHRRAVRRMCFKMGIPFQGLIHDLSKYSKKELEISRFYTGTRSPHDEARDELGYSPSWIYHKARNKHHWEYYTDFNSAVPNADGSFTIYCKCVKIPYKYIIEMVCDFVGAGIAYTKEKWTTKMPLDYWNTKCKGKRAMDPTSERLFENLLIRMSECDTLNEFCKWYKHNKKSLKKEY